MKLFHSVCNIQMYIAVSLELFQIYLNSQLLISNLNFTRVKSNFAKIKNTKN